MLLVETYNVKINKTSHKGRKMQTERMWHWQQISHRGCKYSKIVRFFIINIIGHGYSMHFTIEMIKLRIYVERMKHGQQTQMERATNNADDAEDLSRHIRHRQSGWGINSRRGWSKSRNTQTEQMTDGGTADVNRVDKAQRANADGTGYGRCKRSR